MQHDDFKKGIADLKNRSLAANEKDRLRASLSAYANARPPIESPYRPVPGVFGVFAARPMAYALAAFAFVLLAGGGIAYAAQGSVPGDLLYPVKVNVTEPIEEALAPTPEAKAVVAADQAANRLAEAEMLAKRGKLDATTTAALKQAFAKNVAAFDSFRGELDSEHASSSIERVDSIFAQKMNAYPAAFGMIHMPDDRMPASAASSAPSFENERTATSGEDRAHIGQPPFGEDGNGGASDDGGRFGGDRFDHASSVPSANEDRGTDD